MLRSGAGEAADRRFVPWPLGLPSPDSLQTTKIIYNNNVALNNITFIYLNLSQQCPGLFDQQPSRLARQVAACQKLLGRGDVRLQVSRGITELLLGDCPGRAVDEGDKAIPVLYEKVAGLLGQQH